MYEPAMTSRITGQAFEAATERFARKRLKLRRPELTTPLTKAGSETLRALRPEGRPSAFEAQTTAEGIWVDRSGELVWLECVGSTDTNYRPGLRRSDSARKLGGTLGAVEAVCNYWNVAPPKVVIVTSHAPKQRSAAAIFHFRRHDPRRGRAAQRLQPETTHR